MGDTMGDPWLTIIGMADDTAEALAPASLSALAQAEVIFGGPRHLQLVDAGPRGQAWPVPFSVDPVLEMRGKPIVVLASGDPFWFGAGGSLSAHLQTGEWRVIPAPSTFSLIAGHLGWRMEEISCHGLHATPIASLRQALTPKGRMVCLLRDGKAPAELAQWLTEQGADQAQLWVCERMGGAQQRVRETTAATFDLTDVTAPVALAIALPNNVGLPRVAGLPDDTFAHDGQITKRPVRALTLSALAPRSNERLWDIGAGSGSIAVEWCLAGGRAIAFEQHESRAANIAQNIADFGLSHRMQVVEGDAAMTLQNQPTPDAVFIGGGGTSALFDRLFSFLPKGTRLVANGVTLETESLLTQLHATKGGDLMRIELAQATPLGNMRGWQPARAIVQWSVIL